LQKVLLPYYALEIFPIQSEKTRNFLEKLRRNLCLTLPAFRGKLFLYFLCRIAGAFFHSCTQFYLEKRKKHEN